MDSTINSHGRSLLNLCENNKLATVNHLIHREKEFGGNLTFKRRNEWLSELNICVSMQETLNLIRDLSVRQDVFGSDHAPICVSLE